MNRSSLGDRDLEHELGAKKGRRTRLFRWLFALLVLFGFFLIRSLTQATDQDEEVPSQEIEQNNVREDYFLNQPAIATIPQIAPEAPHPQVSTRAAILIDVASGSVLYADGARQSVPIASTTKLMTALLTRQILDLDEVIEIHRDDTLVAGSKMELRPGEKIRVRDLLSGMLLVSGNDAAYVLARRMSGSVENFATLMNETAARLGMAETAYRDPAGLDDTGRSTAFDLAILARATMIDPVIADYVQRAEMTVTSTDGLVVHTLKNSNRLVGDYQYAGALGLKTGFTPEAGHCLVAVAERNGHELVSVILGTYEDTITASATESQKLLDWGWKHISWPD